MDSHLWTQVISRLDPRDRRLRKGLSDAGLEQLERSLGLRLPEGYRSFLQAHDGGWIGDLKIYGSPEILRMLEMGRDRFTGASESDTSWCSFQAPYRRLLPIHPSSNQSVECLALEPGDGDSVELDSRGDISFSNEEEAAIYWVRFEGIELSSGSVPNGSARSQIESIAGIREIDVDVLTWSQLDPQQKTGDPEIEVTYVDFLDWTLDAILEADVRNPAMISIGGPAGEMR